MATREDLSKCLSVFLDELGFSEERICERIFTNNKCSKAKDISTKRITGRNDIEKIFVGSKREGIGLDYVNDIDVLQIDHGVVCHRGNWKIPQDERTVFITEHENVPPGYCLLRLSRDHIHSESYERIKYALVERKSEKYLSNELFMSKNNDVFKTGTGYISQNTHYMPPQGPSIPKYVEESLLEKYMLSITNLSRTEMDFVRAFPYRAEGMLKRWRKRPREFNWPTAEVINHVVQQPVYIVPVGQKGSQNEDLQWRICFNMAEIHLVQSFNITQTKVLVLLKLIAKHILQPVSKCITSFVMKNVALWLAEKTPQEIYCEKHLIDRLEDALLCLKRFIEKGELPCYMIPQRNLFTGKFQSGEQLLLLEKLDELLHVGFTEVIKYFNTHESNASLYAEIDTITDSLAIAIVLDKLLTFRIAMFTTEQLSEYFVTMFLYKSKFYIFFYHIIFHFVPFLYIYGKQGLFEPLSIGLCEQLSRENEVEDAAVLRKNESSEIVLNEPRNGQKNIREGDFKPFVNLFVLTVFIELVSFFQVPGLSWCLTSKLFQLCLLLVQYVFVWIIELQKALRRKTFIKLDGENIKSITYVPENLMNLGRTGLSLIIVLINLEHKKNTFRFFHTLMYLCFCSLCCSTDAFEPFDSLSIELCEQLSQENEVEEVAVLQKDESSGIVLNEPRNGQKYISEGNYEPFVILFVLTVFIDLVSIFPGLSLCLTSMRFRLFLVFVYFMIIELQKTCRRKTFINKGGENIELITYSRLYTSGYFFKVVYTYFGITGILSSSCM